ncbi:uracil-DNA glycosylase [Mycoplasma sp. 1781]
MKARKKLNMNFNFKNFLAKQKEQEYWKKIEIILKNEDLVPSKNNVFNAFTNFDFSNIKLIILGQDPYPTNDNADGLCFSSKNKITPASLKNIFKEIKNSYPQIKFNSNDLTNWKNQGVLLLNAILTTLKNKTQAHKNQGWEIFNLNLIREILSYYDEILFLAMGIDAQNFIKTLNIKEEFIFKTAHPSPLSCWRGFFNSNIFKRINEKLISLGKNEIDWSTK